MPENSGNFDIGALLQNEDTVRQLKQMAESLGLGAQLDGALQQMQGTPPPPEPNREPHHEPTHEPNREPNHEPHHEPAAEMPPGISQLLRDPAAMAKLGRIMQAMNERGPEYTFLRSLKPLLRPEKGPRVDQALQMMQLLHAMERLKD
jgi:hypothetical protein